MPVFGDKASKEVTEEYGVVCPGPRPALYNVRPQTHTQIDHGGDTGPRPSASLREAVEGAAPPTPGPQTPRLRSRGTGISVLEAFGLWNSGKPREAGTGQWGEATKSRHQLHRKEEKDLSRSAHTSISEICQE